MIDLVSLVVVRRQANISLRVRRVEAWIAACVECIEGSLVETVLADIVQQPDEVVVLLAEDVRQLYRHIVYLLKRLAVEEERRRIDLLNVRALVVLHHRRQLLHVAYHQQLHPTEGFAAAPVVPERHIHRVEQVGADHTDFVDNDKVQCANDVYLLLAQRLVLVGHLILGDEFLNIRQIGAQWQLEETVYRNARSVDGGDTRGCQHHTTLVHRRGYLVQKSSLSRTGFSCQEDRHIGIGHIFLCQP